MQNPSGQQPEGVSRPGAPLIAPMRVSTGRGQVPGWVMWCPGCADYHSVSDDWTFDGDTAAPTFSPSILVQYGRVSRCHSFVQKGQWVFLADCTHTLAGQTVSMVPLPTVPDHA